MPTTMIKPESKQFGLEETKAKEIESLFKPMLKKMTELFNRRATELGIKTSIIPF